MCVLSNIYFLKSLREIVLSEISLVNKFKTSLYVKDRNHMLFIFARIENHLSDGGGSEQQYGRRLSGVTS